MSPEGVRNQVVVSGRLVERQAARYTPAGVMVVEFRLEHESVQHEASGERQVQCEIACMCLGKRAQTLLDVAPGGAVVVKGFLAARNLRWKSTLVLHVTDWKPVQATDTPDI